MFKFLSRNCFTAAVYYKIMFGGSIKIIKWNGCIPHFVLVLPSGEIWHYSAKREETLITIFLGFEGQWKIWESDHE